MEIACLTQKDLVSASVLIRQDILLSISNRTKIALWRFIFILFTIMINSPLSSFVSIRDVNSSYVVIKEVYLLFLASAPSSMHKEVLLTNTI